MANNFSFDPLAPAGSGDEVTPSYLLAGATHATLNNGAEKDASIFDATYDIATKLIPLGIGSGVSQLYNIVPSIGNWAADKAGQGTPFQEIDYAKEVQAFDSDLSKYYTEHQMGADTLGFVLSSFVPGMAGVKVLHAGQAAVRSAVATGKVGTGPLGRSLGVLGGSRDAYIAQAAKEMTVGGGVFKLTEANTLKSIIAGFGQNALEGAAFTGFVNATMFASSPVLSDRDMGDLTFDILVGAGLGGAIGGVISGVTGVRAIKNAAKEANVELAPFGVTEVPPTSFSSSDRIIHNLDQLESKLSLDPSKVSEPLVERAKALQSTTKDTLLREIRTDFQALANDDTPLAQLLNDVTITGSSKAAQANLLDSQAISRVSIQTKVDKELSRIRTKLQAAGNDLAALTDEEAKMYQNTKVSYVRVRGEGAGTVTDERPAILTLGDRLRTGESITLHPQGIKVGSKLFPHKVESSQPFNMMGATLTDVQSRYAWAARLKPWTPDTAPKFIHATDIPLLTKAMDDGLPHINILPESGLHSEIYQLAGPGAIKEFIKKQKSSLAQRMVHSDVMPLTVDEFTDKAASLLGVNFNALPKTKDGFFAQITGLANGKLVEGDVIALSAAKIKRQSLMANIAELKRLEGHQVFQSLVDSSGVVAQNLRSATDSYVTPLMKEVIDLSKARNPALWKSTKPEMIAKRMDTKELFASAYAYASQNPGALSRMPEFDKLAGHLVRPIPQEVLDAVATRATKPSFAEIAAKLDMNESIMRGVYKDEFLFSRAYEKAQYEKLAKAAGTRASQQPAHVDELPSFVKIASDGSRFANLSPHMIDAMATLRSKAALYDSNVNLAATSVLREELPNLPDHLLLKGEDAGPGMLSFTRGDLGSADAITSYVGQRVHNITQNRKTAVSDTFTPVLARLGNDLDAAMEWSMLNETVRSRGSGLKYFPEDTMGPARLATAVDDPIDEAITIKSPIVDELVQLHMRQNSKNLAELAQLRSAEGIQFRRSGDVFYPIPRDLKATPHFAFVIDDSVTGTGHSSMIYAKDGAALEVLKRKVSAEFPEFKILTKDESEAYFKSQGKYEYERTINENYINSALARKGISSSQLPTSDPRQIVTDVLDWHLARQASLVREAVSTKYSRQMNVLRAQAEPALQAAKSRFGYVSPTAFAENSVNNPATNAMKQMLNIQKSEEYPFWSTMNRTLDEKFSRVSADVAKMWESAVHPEQLKDIDAALRKAGYGGPMVDDALYEAMNGRLSRGELTGLVAKMNGLIGTIALRTDPMNAINNVIGHAVLYGTESKAVINAIKNGSKEGAGDLAALSQIRLPGTDSYIFSHQKVLAKSFERLASNPELRAFYKEKGFITSIMDQYDQTLDHLAIRAGDSASDITGRIANAMNAARGVGNNLEVLTGNKVAEEFNRFLAADYMKQLTEVAVKHGVMKEADALPYINSFVNRTQGNFLASQRPVLFQGPVGQAIGLFQTYQFNLIQQMLRHVGDGNIRNVATMMGLQGTIFGMSGLPAFNAINTHLVGNAGGNTEHKDIYQAIFNGAGKEAGEWIAYGALSNFLGIFDPSLKTNLYTRGDINPRSITIVPTDPSKIPIYQATERFFTNMFDSVSQLNMGADLWPTVLRSLEHNGISRPLAGMAQVLGGLTNESGKIVSTSKEGNLLMAQDLTFLASMARMAGAKPLEEAMVNDEMFRINTYRSADAARRAGLGEAIKTNLLSGREPTEDELNTFMERYTRSGGKQEEFNSFISRQYRNASTSQAEQLRAKLSQPYSMRLQSLMGGSDAGIPY